MNTARQLRELASAARRADIAAAITDDIPTVECGRFTRDLNVALRPSTETIEVVRWDPPGRAPLWLLTAAIVDMGGGDASVEEMIVLTEYDVTDERVRDLVLRIVEGAGPARFEREWMSTNTQFRLRHDGDLPGAAGRLAAGLAAWAAAVTELRLVDSRPLPTPVAGWREL
jgi:hypothetical protein